jgi:hypothetical protein
MVVDTSEPGTIRVSFNGPIDRAALPALYGSVWPALVQSRAKLVLCDLTHAWPDAVTVEVLARIRLATKRHAAGLRLENGSSDLRDLIAFMGLSGVRPLF